MTDTVDVLEAECRSIATLLDELSDDDWQRPTRCPPMSVLNLVTHMAGTGEMTAKLASSSRAGHEPNVDRATWWVSPSRRPPADILADALDASEGLDGPKATEKFVRNAALMVETIRSAGPDAIVGNEWRTIRAGELAGSRCLEFGVHSMDLGHATARGERITAETAQLVKEILDTLLGQPLPRHLGWDKRTYILTGTGRRELSSNERFVLGALSDRFPLFR